MKGDASFIYFLEDEIKLRVKLVPSARKTGKLVVYGGRLKLSVSSPPVDGKANDALIEYLAVELGCAKGAIRILRGLTSQEKEITVRGVTKDTVVKWLTRYGITF